MDYAELRAAAEAATPGPWVSADNKRGPTKSVWLEYTAREVRESEWGPNFPDRPSRYGPHRDYIANCIKLWKQPGDAKDNARYIALANPQTVLALLDELDDWRGGLGS